MFSASVCLTWEQAMDIAGLSKLTADSLVTIVMALGFMVGQILHFPHDERADRITCL